MINRVQGFRYLWKSALQGALHADVSARLGIRHRKYASLADVPSSHRPFLHAKAALIYFPWQIVQAPLPTFKTFRVNLYSSRTDSLLSLLCGQDQDRVQRAYHGTAYWLVNSGIQSPTEGIDNAGAVYAWFDPSKQTYAYPYGEITGYFMTWAVYQYNLTGDREFLEQAVRTVPWIDQHAMHPEEGGIWDRIPPVTPSPLRQTENYLYTFDTGMVITGLVNLYRMTGQEAYLRLSERALHFVLNRGLRADALFYARFDPWRQSVSDSSDHWSSTPGCWQSKLALPLLLFDHSGIKMREAHNAAQGICDRILACQQPDGAFSLNPDSALVYSHETCYAAEGLSVAGLMLNRPHYLRAARRAFLFLLSHQLPEGGIPRLIVESIPHNSETSDVSAQVLRLGGLFAIRNELGPSEIEKLKALLDRLLSRQRWSDNLHENGGMEYGLDMEGRKLGHLNAWATMFANQAFAIWSGLVDPVKLFQNGLLV